ncbi:SDR family oxidoreductase [Streptomyces sp. NBC_00370]|uniref:SDR family oxidoreductase n=1 Tax=Streptomyces sp. NBC_00370 TaxID=2975728 RepID=UPI002E26E12A
MSVVVTGATGHLGKLVIASLLDSGVPAAGIAAVARSKEKAAEFEARGVEVRIADYDDPQSLAAAFRPGDRVVLISGSEVGRRVPQHGAVVDAAKAAGVAQLAYTGALGGPEADFALADEHKVTEQLILDSGLPYTFLRNGWYSEVYTENLAPVLASGEVVTNAGDGRVSSAARADYAAAVAAVLTGEGHLNTVYELSGDSAWSFDEYAAELSRQTGSTIVHRSVSEAEHTAIFVGIGLPQPFAEILAGVDTAISRGLIAGTSGDLARLIGRPTTPLADSIAAALAS